MSKTYVRAKPQSLKQNSNTNGNNKKTKNYKPYNKKSTSRKYYNNNNNYNGKSNNKIQKKKELNKTSVTAIVTKKMVHFNEIVEVGYTHSYDEYDRTSIVASKLTSEDIVEILNLREQFKMENLEAQKKRAMEENQQQSSPIMNTIIPSSPNMNFAIYASTSQGNSSLLTEVPSLTTSIISSPVLTPRTNDDEISQKQREIEYMIYQRQQLENSYLEALHYQHVLQLLNQQQQQQNYDLWRVYSQPQSLVESDIYLQQANNSYYSSALSNKNMVSPSMSIWYAQDSVPLMV